MLYLHIGTHKTGTSAVQTFFSREENALCGRVHYLAAARTPHGAHHPLAWSMRGIKDADLSLWDAVRIELVAHSRATSLISSEAMWFTDPAGVKAQLGNTDVRIVVYLRRQDQYLQSLYKQAGATGRKMSFAEWQGRFYERGDYLSVVRRWAEAFGAERIVVRPYERAGKRINAILDLLSVMGVDGVSENDTQAAHDLARVHPTARRELLELVRALNHVDVDIEPQKLLAAILNCDTEYYRAADLLSFDECCALMDTYSAGNRALEAEFYRDTSTPLFAPLVEGPPPVIWQPGDKEYFAMTVDVFECLADALGAPAKDGPKPGQKRKPKREET